MNDSSNLLVGIFADDLTAALDASAPFAAQGFRTVVSSTSEFPHSWVTEATSDSSHQYLLLVDALKRVKTYRIVLCTRAANEHAKQLGFEKPRIAVCGVNPHSGDGGRFGVEEAEEIAPAVEILRAEGIDADGPVSPDSAFRIAHEGWYDIVVAMYHDQGHIRMKLAAFETGVNVTAGVPIIRTVDHGTAFDIA